jgi:glycosyltransferase involved in cell wall biosynthesis
MASRIASAADRNFVTIPAWTPLLKSLAPNCVEPEWLPVPSNLPAHADNVEISKLRMQFQPDRDGTLMGHFGTYGELVAKPLRELLPSLLSVDPTRRCLLLGRGSIAFLDALGAKYPELRPRCSATGDLAPDAIAAHLAACDLLVQPFPDGISSRRTTAMSGLALGVPLLTTEGHLTESIWAQTQAVALSPVGADRKLLDLAEELLRQPERRKALGVRGQQLYRERFGLEHLINRLRSGSPT